MATKKPKRPGKKYKWDGFVWYKTDVRPAKKELKKYLTGAGISISKHKKAMRAAGNKHNANWL